MAHSEGVGTQRANVAAVVQVGGLVNLRAGQTVCAGFDRRQSLIVIHNYPAGS